MNAQFLDSSIAWLRSLPQRFADTVLGAATDILDGYPDTLGVMVIGSLPENVYDDASDVDILYVRETKIPNEVILGIKHVWPLAQFIVRTPARLVTELQEGSVAAWSIRRGMVVYDPRHLLREFRRQEVPLPTRGWIVKRARYVASWPSDVEGLTRKALNLAVLMLARQGVVVTTKQQLRRDFPRYVQQPLLCRAIDLVTIRQPSANRDACAAQTDLLAGAVDVLVGQAIRG